MVSSRIKTITRGRKGRYWFTHPSEGISYDPGTNETQYLSYKGFGAEVLDSNEIACLAFGPIGSVWVLYTDGNIETINPNTKTVIDNLSLHYIQDTPYPYLSRDELSRQLYKKKLLIPSYAAYAEAGLSETLNKEELALAQKFEVTTLETKFFQNRAGKMKAIELPL